MSLPSLTFVLSRVLLGCCLLLSVAGVQVLGLDAGAPGLIAPQGAVAATGDSHFLSYEGGADEVGLPSVAMPLGTLATGEEPLPRLQAECLRYRPSQAVALGRRVWRAVSRGPPSTGC